MKLSHWLAVLSFGLLPLSTPVLAESNLLGFKLRTLAGDEVVDLRQTYAGKVVLIVNTASKCGFTDQFEGLEALYRKYRDQGFVVLGFPSNDFANQDPGTEKEIQAFCRNTYSVEFPMFEKVHVRGSEAHPLFKALAAHPEGTTPKWNFYKFLLNRNGQLVESWSSITTPESRDLVEPIERLLAQPAPMPKTSP
ncbi:MAG TPA: glutathione peroxidase [bacterium]|nr:glutathione peroxidase [bacterium]